MKAPTRVLAALAAACLSLWSGSGFAAKPGWRKVVEEVGPPRPYWAGSRRGVADMQEGNRFGALVGPGLEVACEPTSGVVAVRGPEGSLGTAATSNEGAKGVFARLPLAGDLAAPNDLKLASVRKVDGVNTYAYRRGEGPIACDCAVTVVMLDNGTVVRAEGRKLLGYRALPQAPRYTRGEAFEAAMRQLVLERPALTEATGIENPELSSVIVVPVADRAVLAHRLALRLDGLPYVVDVDDATLTVVRVTPDRRFDRVETIEYEVPIIEVFWSGPG